MHMDRSSGTLIREIELASAAPGDVSVIIELASAVNDAPLVPGAGRCLHCARATPCVVPTEADYAADDDLYECWESLELRAWGACPSCRGRGTVPAGGSCDSCQGRGLREIVADASLWDDAIKANPNQGLARA